MFAAVFRAVAWFLTLFMDYSGHPLWEYESCAMSDTEDSHK
ncbi:hypothetical protein [Rhodococcus sp. LB1]|nr:hypothetical protein [Rhodococcus sp. LB1]